jgi:UDP-GlcNAc:undecaprenyl-phosphate GlcNAc-1-phosphate transferase
MRPGFLPTPPLGMQSAFQWKSWLRVIPPNPMVIGEMDLLTHTDWLKIAFCLSLGFFICWLSISVILQWADHGGSGNRGRDFHHAHESPVIRLGGIALAAAFTLVASVIYWFGALSAAGTHTLGIIVIGSLLMFGLGLWDDLRGLGARCKFAAQIAIAGGVYFGGIKIDVLKNPFTDIEHAMGVFGFFITIGWIVTLTNLINLIDGIDGLAGGICLMLMCLLANLGMGGDSDFSMLLAIGVAGALLGFLKFNYPPARIHMGDGGAYFLGFLIGALSIVNSHKGTVVAALIAPAFALALPIVDVSLAILRRGLRGLPVFRPDRKHIHHHLLTMGFSRERAVLVLYMISSLCLFLAFEVFWLQGRLLPLFSGLLFLILVMAGHFSGFTKDWFAVGDLLGKSLALRRETRYALTLSRWFQLEAERYHSVEELWQDYQFIVKKLGFSRVRLVLPDGANTWEAEGFDEKGVGLQEACHEIGDGSVLEFTADRRVLPEALFKLLADLTAEIWHKAALRWRILNKTPFHFRTEKTLPDFPSPGKVVRFYTPVGR